MMPASTNGAPVGAIAAAMRSTVRGLTALQSTNSGLLLLAVNAGAKRCASATASPGGRIERMKSVAAISSSLAAVRPYFLARATVSALRPVSEVSTLRPFSTSRPATAAPIMPGAMTATTGFRCCSPVPPGLLRRAICTLPRGHGKGATPAWQSRLFRLCCGRFRSNDKQEIPVPADLADARYQVALANRMLANEGVLDAFGHV